MTSTLREGPRSDATGTVWRHREVPRLPDDRSLLLQGPPPAGLFLSCLLDHLALERLEHQQRPQDGAVLACAADMLRDEPLDAAHVEQAGPAEASRQQGFAQAIAQRAAEPARDRHREAHLPAIQDR